MSPAGWVWLVGWFIAWVYLTRYWWFSEVTKKPPAKRQSLKVIGIAAFMLSFLWFVWGAWVFYGALLNLMVKKPPVSVLERLNAERQRELDR